MTLRKGELIGLHVEVVGATDAGQIGIKGRVVDETMKMLVIEMEGKEKMVQKRGSVFRFDTRGGVSVRGEEILFRPEERVKRAR